MDRDTHFHDKKSVEEYLSGDRIECLICHKTFRALGSHLFAKHNGMSGDEYKERFGIPYKYGLVTCDVSEVMSENTYRRIAKGDIVPGNIDKRSLRGITRRKSHTYPTNIIHGHSGKHRTPTYQTWNSMVAHFNKNEAAVCKRWVDSFEDFLSDMGERPEGMILVRDDAKLPFSPENCFWGTRQDVDMTNVGRAGTKIEFDGVVKNITDWAKELDIPVTRLYGRRKRGVLSAKELLVRRQKRFATNVKHNMTKTPTYSSWQAMKHNCCNAGFEGYKNYGGRGIAICERWLNSFENFLEDMGERPEGKFLRRHDVNGNYSPENCYWGTLHGKRRPFTKEHKQRLTKHGLSNTPAYQAWASAKKRCGVCREWEVFEAFLADMGIRPENKILVRKDTNAVLSKDNCFWGTRKQRNANLKSSGRA